MGRKEKIKIISLGGCYEIGMNLMVFETKKDIIAIDSGIGFADNNNFGVDVLISDHTYLKDRLDKIRALVITHGHEDHIGAVTHFLQIKNIPVYSTRFPSKLIEDKCKEEKIECDLKMVKQFQEYSIGDFKITYFPVDHSIVETSGLKICANNYKITYMSDFKIGKGRSTYLKNFKKLDLIRTDLLFMDSTNINVKGWCEEEDILKPELMRIIGKSSKKVFFTTFASNIKRIQTAIDIAKKCRRKIFFVGRSMHTYSRIARDMGYLEYEDSDIDIIENVKFYRSEKIFVLATGSQGENRSIMKRLSLNEMKHLKLSKGDSIIFSSKIIPGNERSIRTLINDICKLKGIVFTEEAHKIHVSGHAKRDELEFVMKNLKPKNFIPVHGEYRFLCDHVLMSQKYGLSEKTAKIAENGQEIFLTESGLKYGAFHEFKPTSLDFINQEIILNDVLRERKKIARIGVVFIVIHICKNKKILKEKIKIVSKGFSVGVRDACFYREMDLYLNQKINEFFHDKKTSSIKDIDGLEDFVSMHAKRFIYKSLNFKPIVVSQSIFS